MMINIKRIFRGEPIWTGTSNIGVHAGDQLAETWDNPFDASIYGDSDWLEQVAEWQDKHGMTDAERLQCIDGALAHLRSKKPGP